VNGFDVMRLDVAANEMPKQRGLDCMLLERASGDVYFHASLIGGQCRVFFLASYEGEPIVMNDGEIYVRASFIRSLDPDIADVLDNIEAKVRAIAETDDSA
jgi:hypothetical protein